MNSPTWACISLAECVVSVGAGVSVNSEDRPHVAGEVGVLKTSAVSGGVFKVYEHKTVISKDRPRVAEPVVGGSVLFSRMNTPVLVGESCYVESDHPSLFLPDRLWQIRVEPRLVDARWLSYILQSGAVSSAVRALATGTSASMKNIAKRSLLAFKIPLPSLAEQRWIANVLNALDDQIRIGNEMVAKLDRLSAGLANRLLHDGADGGELPAGWKSSTVGEVYEVQAGITLGPHRAPGRDSTGYLRVANVQRSVVRLDDIARLNASPVDQAKYRLTGGDLLLVEGHADVNQIGRCARVPEGAEGLVYQNHLFRLRSTQLDQVVGEAWMNSRFARQYWRRMCSSSSGLNTINSKQLKAMRVLVPPPEEQARISTTLLGMAERIQRERDASDKLALLKAGLMADLLTGRVRVPTEVVHE
jgi:type I restriction enzyme S subunit